MRWLIVFGIALFLFIGISPINAVAYSDNYSHKTVCPGGGYFSAGDYYNSSLNCWIDGDNSFCQCNCTACAAYRLNAVAPIGFDNSYGLSSGDKWGDGNEWSGAAGRAGVPLSNKPLPGDIAFWNYGTWGHVAFVEKVNYNEQGIATSIDITEYNYTTSEDFGSRTISLTSGSKPSGYIQFLTHSFSNLVCSPYSDGRQLCWSYESDVSCQNGSGHFFDDESQGICVMTDSSSCSGVSGSTRTIAGGRGGGALGIITGPGATTTATDTTDPGKPDFVIDKIWLEDLNGNEMYTFSRSDEIKIRMILKNIGSDDIPANDTIETRIYLSDGYKVDPSDNWIKIGTETTLGSELDPDETHSEAEYFKLWEESHIEAGKTYNLVVCVDRTADHNNGSGAYAEEHESNNCSTEAVFTVNQEFSSQRTRHWLKTCAAINCF